MKKFKFFAFILVALIALNASCHREPVVPDIPIPTPQGLDGQITTEPIVDHGVETGYSLSYRSWIIPGEGNSGTKSAASPKGGASHDTVSVILHDQFYNVDTCAYVTDWNPARYASYTCQWIKSANVGAPENNITMIDSVAILRVQYQEFSFDYCIRFEVAYYNDGSYSCIMPHYSPVVTDLGAQELEGMQTVVKNGNVYARKLLKHSIRVVIGNTPYVLNAVDTLYRHLPNANPSKFVLWSEMVSEEIPSSLIITNEEFTGIHLYYPYKCKFKQYYSDGTTGFSEIDLSEEPVVGGPAGYWGVENANAHCENVMSLYDVSSVNFSPVATNPINIDEYASYICNINQVVVTFSGEGAGYIPCNSTYVVDISCVYDDGYLCHQKNINTTCSYARKEKICDETLQDPMQLKFYFNCQIANLQYEKFMCGLTFDHL